ncbi:hypothetical protein [Candidatus Nitrospira nitrosa]|nr:hypothetical protein [Candidatus Nitrospira nitrosa]
MLKMIFRRVTSWPMAVMMLCTTTFVGCNSMEMAGTNSVGSKAASTGFTSGIDDLKSLTPMDVTEVESIQESQAAKDNPWKLNLLNMTSDCIVRASIKPQNGQYGKWFSIPKTCRTCNENYETCFNEKKWQTILVTECTDTPFDIRLAVEPNQNGQATGAEFTDIRPNCNYAGGTIGVH